MEANRGPRHRAAVAIVAGIVNVLQDKRSKEPTPEVARVISLDDEFPPVIQPAVAQQEAAPAKRKVAAVGARNGILNQSRVGAGLFLPPSPSPGPGTYRDRLVHLPIGERFVAGLLPAPT